MNRLTCLGNTAFETMQSVSAPLAWVLIGLLLVVSLAGTPLVMLLYRWRVSKLMSERKADAAGEAASGTAEAEAAGTAVVRPVDERPRAEAIVEAVEERLARLRRVLMAACAVYALLGGAILTLSPSGTDRDVPLGVPEGGALWAIGAIDVVLVGALAAPIVLAGIAHPRFGRVFARVVVPVLLLAMTARAAVVETLDPGKQGIGEFLAVPMLGVPIALLFYVAIARRHARQIVPVLTVLLGTIAAGGALVAVLGESADKCLREHWLELLVWIGVPVAALGGLWAAWRAVRALSAAFEHKRVSDSQVQTAAWLLTLSAVVLGFASGFGDSRGPWAPALAAITLLAYLVYRIGMAGQSAWRQPIGLLLLRVFARDDRGERLLDELAFHWRFVGPIHMIGGPDMAQQTLDPHELLLFLRWRVRDQFIATGAALRARLDALDLAPDPDGRYRINEFFCLDNTWQRSVAALLARSDVVLLDLRGFTEQRGGTGFEIGLLASRRALPRTVCLVDEHTDRAAAGRFAAQGGGRLDEARLLEVGRELDAPRVLRELAKAAASPA